MIAVALIALAATVPQALAHGGVLSYTFEGKDYPGFKPYNSASGQSTIQRPWATYDPIQDATASTVACNDDGTSLASGQLTATISAGSTIRANWNTPWPHPYGPQMTYLAKCPGSTCTGVDAKTLKWFKIDEAGLLSGTVANGYWGAGKMIDQNNTWTSTIPKSVPSGSYLIRFETVALHSLPAQLYPECAQIDIINGGSLAPTSAELVSFPGGYSNSDPGFQVDLYGQAAKTQTTYQIPGPKLYAGATATTGGGSGGSGPSSSTTGATTTTTRSTTTSTTTTRTTTTSSAPTSGSGGAAQYAQCGGKGWTGPTTCASPYKCTAQNDYYSQCI